MKVTFFRQPGLVSAIVPRSEMQSEDNLVKKRFFDWDYRVGHGYPTGIDFTCEVCRRQGVTTSAIIAPSANVQTRHVLCDDRSC